MRQLKESVNVIYIQMIRQELKSNEIVAKCRKLKQEHGLKLIVIDYLQLITGSSNNRAIKTTRSLRYFKTIKKCWPENQMFLLLLYHSYHVQLNKEPNKTIQIDCLTCVNQEPSNKMLISLPLFLEKDIIKASEGKRKRKIMV